MSGVTLYDSRGYPLDDPDGERNEKIRNMSRYGVVFIISDAQPFELTTYFRAYESASGRMEQYYATYTTASDHALLREFREAVIDVAETEHGLKIERSESGENILSNLDATDPGQVGTDRQRSRARELLSSGERLRFGVGSYEKAFKLVGELGSARPGMEIAITEGESTHAGPMSTYDLIIEKGSYMGLEPLGQTEALMNPDPDLSDEDHDDSVIAEVAIDIGYAVAAAALLVLVWVVVAGLLFNPVGLDPLFGANEFYWAHDVDVNATGANQIVVTGETPADSLIVVYVNETRGINDKKQVPVEEHRNFTFKRSIPPDTDLVRIRSLGIVKWSIASTSVERGGHDSSTPDPSSTPSKNSPSTNQSSPTSPANESTENGTNTETSTSTPTPIPSENSTSTNQSSTTSPANESTENGTNTETSTSTPTPTPSENSTSTNQSSMMTRRVGRTDRHTNRS